jgi:hypothetical protein
MKQWLLGSVLVSMLCVACGDDEKSLDSEESPADVGGSDAAGSSGSEPTSPLDAGFRGRDSDPNPSSDASFGDDDGDRGAERDDDERGDGGRGRVRADGGRGFSGFGDGGFGGFRDGGRPSRDNAGESADGGRGRNGGNSGGGARP